MGLVSLNNITSVIYLDAAIFHEKAVGNRKDNT